MARSSFTSFEERRSERFNRLLSHCIVLTVIYFSAAKMPSTLILLLEYEHSISITLSTVNKAYSAVS